MNQITDISYARAKRLEQEELNEFGWIDRFILTQDAVPAFVNFTPEGRSYYQKWFTRYGYSVELMKDLDTFFRTVREILRLRVEKAPPLDPNDPLNQRSEMVIAAEDAQALIELATQIKDTPRA